jgi:hypothetical protein
MDQFVNIEYKKVLLPCSKIGGQDKYCILTFAHDEAELQKDGRGDDKEGFSLRW